jgi:hypothetical protein
MDEVYSHGWSKRRRADSGSRFWLAPSLPLGLTRQAVA